jgi:hypothetical protein
MNAKRRYLEILVTPAILACALATLVATPAQAQLNGENLLGDVGVKSGTQPNPGLYVGMLYYRYYTDTIKDRNGDRITLDPNQGGSQTINAFVPLVTYISQAKVLGANYGMMAVMPLANGSLEAPAFGFGPDISTGPGDLYLVPLQLGWHLPRADATIAFGFFAPTGRYTSGAADNVGKGMWSYEFSGGTTVYLDERKTLSVATTAYWEIHSKKKDSGSIPIGPLTLTGVTVGQLLTLEGGVGKSFLDGAASAGLAYYTQSKVTADDFGFPIDIPGGPTIGKHRVWAFGPDVTVPIAAKSKLISLVNVRYLWETGARVKTEGQSLVVTVTLPVPSIPIGSRP